MAELNLKWRVREARRQRERTPLVWANEPFWTSRDHIWAGHYPYIADGGERLIGYTPDESYGQRDIQRRIKPGRYLSKYFGHVLSTKEIAHYVSWHNAGRLQTPWDGCELKLAVTPEEIVRVYQEGPSSCMALRSESPSKHPVRVYGAGDLAIAYLQPKDRPIARALCWPEKKVYGRLYPTPEAWALDPKLYSGPDDARMAQAALENILRKHGYGPDLKGQFAGARLLKEPAERINTVRLPYLDHGYYVTLGDGCLELAVKENLARSLTHRFRAASGSITSGAVFLAEGEYLKSCEYCEAPICEPEQPVTVYRDWDLRYERPCEPQAFCTHCAESVGWVDSLSGLRCSFSGRSLHDGRQVPLAWADWHCYRSELTGLWFVTSENPQVRYCNVICATSELPSAREALQVQLVKSPLGGRRIGF